MNEVIVSVIVPARNEHRMIGQTLDHILCSAKKLGDGIVEVIVIDNGSTDGTWKVLEQYSVLENLIAIRLDRLGAARARNHGRRHAVGRILVFVDADTWISEGCLQRIFEHCQFGGVQAGITRLAGIDEDLRARVWWLFWEHVRRLPMPNAKAMPALMFCTAEAFDAFGPFDETVAIGEEWPILAEVYRDNPRRFVYDRSITALSSSRRMHAQPFGYTRTFLKYVWAVLHRSGRIHYTDRIR